LSTLSSKPAAFLHYFSSTGEKSVNTSVLRFFADLLWHSATIERFDLHPETVQMKPRRYRGHGKELADNVLALVNRLGAQSIEIFGRLFDENSKSGASSHGSNHWNCKMVACSWSMKSAIAAVRFTSILQCSAAAPPPIYA
jgi:hypothetical protein